MSSLDIATCLGIATALAAWVAIYLQHRSIALSEQEMKTRVASLEDLTQRIAKEREERQRQIDEREQAHTDLLREKLLQDIHMGGDTNNLLLMRHLLIFQSLANLYLAKAQEYDKHDPAIAGYFTTLNGTMIEWIARSNYLHVLGKQSATVEAIEKAVRDEVDTLSKVQNAGMALLTSLEALGVIGRADGTKLSDAFRPFKELVDDLKVPVARLQDLHQRKWTWKL